MKTYANFANLRQLSDSCSPIESGLVISPDVPHKNIKHYHFLSSFHPLAIFCLHRWRVSLILTSLWIHLQYFYSFFILLVPENKLTSLPHKLFTLFLTTCHTNPPRPTSFHNVHSRLIIFLVACLLGSLYHSINLLQQLSVFWIALSYPYSFQIDPACFRYSLIIMLLCCCDSKEQQPMDQEELYSTL